jgi:HPt (histidine-containing phosphotransfer) domain-containing protein
VDYLIDRVLLNDFICEQLGEDKAFFDNLLSLLAVQLQEYGAEVFTGTPENVVELGKGAHRLKSSCQSFGATGLVELLHDIEIAAKASDAAAVETLFKQTVAVLPKIVSEITTLSNEIFSGRKISA